MPSLAPAARVEAIRAFNRFYTTRIGVLREGLHDSPHPLPEARVLFELGRGGMTEVGDLRRRLDMDAGFARGHDPARARAWIATVDGRPAGCVLCVRRDDEVAALRLLLVEPWARGLGLGGRLIDACVGFARRAGYRTLALWTNHPLVEARRLYARRGFVPVSEAPHADWGVDLVGQELALEL